MASIKNALIPISFVFFNFICLAQAPTINDLPRLTPEEIAALAEKYSLTSREEKTPTSPDVIEHQPSIKGGIQRFFHRKRIYFGKDEQGKPCYQSIAQHEKNPEFGKIKVVLFHEKGTYQKKYIKTYMQDSFEKIGVYGDVKARNRLVRATVDHGSLWCPQYNMFIGGTRDKNMCDRFTAYLDEQGQQEAHTKLSKI